MVVALNRVVIIFFCSLGGVVGPRELGESGAVVGALTAWMVCDYNPHPPEGCEVLVDMNDCIQ